jgi:plasmid stabilization system protein ParE
MKRYVLSSAAQSDLTQIRDYILNDAGIRVARHLLAAIISAFRTLARSPGLGHRRDDLTERSELRFWPVYSYLIVYRVDKTPLSIIAVLHAKRDVPALLERR